MQKSGVPVNEIDHSIIIASKKLILRDRSMIIPPNDNQPEKYFKSLNDLKNSLALKELSMGMSQDYEIAVKYGATFVRIGSSIFGPRS